MDILLLLAYTPVILAIGIAADLTFNNGYGLKRIIEAYKGIKDIEPETPLVDTIRELEEEMGYLFDELANADYSYEETAIKAKMDLKQVIMDKLLVQLNEPK